jgi:hypothetical protein
MAVAAIERTAQEQVQKLDGQEEKQDRHRTLRAGLQNRSRLGSSPKPIANFAVEATGSSTDLDSITKKNYVELCSQKRAY